MMGKSYTPRLLLEEYERERQKVLNEATIKKRLKEYIAIAEYNNVRFNVTQDKKGWWTISVEGEEGMITGVPTARVAKLVHGLYIMGSRLRAKRMSLDWSNWGM